MKGILILVLALILAACGGNGKSGGGSSVPPATDTTKLHGNVAHVVLTGIVKQIHVKAEKFVLAADGQTFTVKVHPTVFLAGEEEMPFENLTVGQAVTVAGVQNPGIVKADTVWLEPQG